MAGERDSALISGGGVGEGCADTREVRGGLEQGEVGGEDGDGFGDGVGGGGSDVERDDWGTEVA